MIQIEWTPALGGDAHISCTLGSCAIDTDTIGVEAILHLVAHMQNLNIRDIPHRTGFME